MLEKKTAVNAVFQSFLRSLAKSSRGYSGFMRQSPAQALGRKGERWFENALPKQWVFQRPSEDFGIDGTVLLGTDTQLSGIEFGVQVKASQHWMPHDGSFLVRGIQRATLVHWGARLIPTMIALYDESANEGYYAWVLDVLPDITSLLRSRQRSITLKVPTGARLADDCWDRVESWLYHHHLGLANALSSANMLPSINALSQAARLLQFLELQAPATSEDQRMVASLSDIIAHRDVILALKQLIDRDHLSPVLIKHFETAMVSYRAELENCVSDVDEVLQSTGRSVAVWTNEKQMDALRPRLLFMITDLLTALSGMGCCYHSRFP